MTDTPAPKRPPNPAVTAAADNNLYRVCGSSPAQWRSGYHPASYAWRPATWWQHLRIDGASRARKVRIGRKCRPIRGRYPYQGVTSDRW